MCTSSKGPLQGLRSRGHSHTTRPHMADDAGLLLSCRSLSMSLHGPVEKSATSLSQLYSHDPCLDDRHGVCQVVKGQKVMPPKVHCTLTHLGCSFWLLCQQLCKALTRWLQ